MNHYLMTTDHMYRSLKYLLIVFANLIILSGLLTLWADPLQIRISEWTVAIGVLYILTITFLSLIGIRILVAIFRRRRIEIPKKIIISVIFTLLISSWLYVGYIKKAVNNRIINWNTRQLALLKIRDNNIPYGSGFYAQNLTRGEYHQIAKIKGFKKVPIGASDINISYTISGMPGDYVFNLTYQLPLGSEVDETENVGGDIIEHQGFEEKSDIIKVTYYKARF